MFITGGGQKGEGKEGGKERGRLHNMLNLCIVKYA